MLPHAIGTGGPAAASSEVTPLSVMPHGTIRPKWERSVLTLSAKPWLVTQREMRTPMAASFCVADPDAGQARDTRPAVTPNVRDRPDQHFLEVAHVAMHVAAIRLADRGSDSRRAVRGRDT